MSESIEKAWKLGGQVADLFDAERFDERDKLKPELGGILSPFTIGTDFRQDILDAYWEGYGRQPLPEFTGK